VRMMPVLRLANPFTGAGAPNHPNHRRRSSAGAKFFLNIIYRFGVPNYIITDHGTNFTAKKFLDFSNGYGIRICWASVGHPRTNG